jgi:cation diffusion facilitator family transporter
MTLYLHMYEGKMVLLPPIPENGPLMSHLRDRHRTHQPADEHEHGHDELEHGHDGHGHGHGRAAGWWGRVRHALAGLRGGHSHDPVDQIDDALEANQAGRRALLISLVGLGLTALIQGVVVVLSGSVALLGDTFHNIADALTAVPLLIAFALGRRPVSKRYTYGYGRAEDLGGLFVVVMITLSAGFAAYEAIRRLFNPQDVTHLWVVAAAAVVGFAGNELVARYRIRVGRRIGSAALVADGLHARTDGFTSLAVLLGAGGAALGWWWADPVVGLLITVAILGVLRSAVSQVGARLMDAVDPGTVDQAMAAIRSVEGVRGVNDLRLRWIGHGLRAEADVAVDPGLTLGEGHDVAHHVEQHLIADVGRLQAATVHVSPHVHLSPDD